MLPAMAALKMPTTAWPVMTHKKSSSKETAKIFVMMISILTPIGFVKVLLHLFSWSGEQKRRRKRGGGN